MTESPKLAMKSPSIESLASSVHTSDDVKSVQGQLFDAIEKGDTQDLNSMLNDERINTAILQILLMKTIPNDDEKYSLEPDASVNHLLGNSFTNLNTLQLVCLLGDEDMAIVLFDFLLQMTLEMDSKILLLEFIHRTFGRNNTILHLAAYLGYKNLVQKLIEAGASVYVRNDYNYKPIDLVDDPETSIIFNNTPSAPPRSVRSLDLPPKKLSRQNTPLKLINIPASGSCSRPKTKKSVKFDCSSTLLDICKHGLPKTMTITDFKLLINQCNYSEILSPQKNMTLVHIASSYGHSDILQALLESSAILLNRQDIEGWSPAHCASAEGHLNILHLLGKFGPLVRANLWAYFAEFPIDLEIRTFDGESIEDVCLPETKNEIIQILCDLRSLQNMACSIEPGCLLSYKNNLLSDSKMDGYISNGISSLVNLKEMCSSLESSKFGSVNDAVFHSNTTIIASKQSINTHTDIQDSLTFHYSDKENEPKTMAPFTVTSIKLNTSDSLVAKEEQSSAESLVFHSGTKPMDHIPNSTSSQELSLIDPNQIENRMFGLFEVPKIQYVANTKTNNETHIPTKSPRKPFADLERSHFLENPTEEIDPSKDTAWDVLDSNQELSPIAFNSRNPFLNIMFSSEGKSLSLKDQNTDHDVNVSKGDVTNIKCDDGECFSGLSVLERMKRLKQLGVQ